MYPNSSNNPYSYSFTPYPQYQSEPTPVQPPKKKRTALKLIALCLCCALLGGAGGIAAAYLWGPSQNASGGNGINISVASPMANSSTATPAVTGEKLSGSEIYDLGTKSCVGISTEVYTNYWGQQVASEISGSGFVISADGYIMTNYHVIEAAVSDNLDIQVVLYTGDSYTAKFIGGDEDNDIAVIKIEATGLTPVVLGDSDTMKVGETIYAIGNPLGTLEYTMTSGIVSALDRDMEIELESGGTATIDMFQIDAAINSGNSGGPVFNEYGYVIGVASAKYSASGVEGLGFAIPIDDAMSIINDVLEHGYVTGKPSLGIEVYPVTAKEAMYYNLVQGSCIVNIDEGSCSYKAGLRKGDVITKFGDTDVTNNNDLTSAKKDYKAGDTVAVTVYRSGEYFTYDVVLDEAKS